MNLLESLNIDLSSNDICNIPYQFNEAFKGSPNLNDMFLSLNDSSCPTIELDGLFQAFDNLDELDSVNILISNDIKL